MILDLAPWVISLLFFAVTVLVVYIVIMQGRTLWGEYESVFMQTASLNLEDMFLFIDPQRLFHFNLVGVVIMGLLTYTITGNPVVALIAVLVTAILPFRIYKLMKRRRLKAFERIFPDGLSMIASSLKAGASLNAALESMAREQPAPLNQEFMLVLHEQRMGIDLAVSLRSMEERIPLADLQLFVAAFSISRDVGGNLSETIERLADSLRRKAVMEGKIDALTSQGRLQGIIMVILPLLLLGALFYFEPEAMSKLTTEPIGWLVLAIITVMIVVGYFFVRKIVNIEV